MFEVEYGVEQAVRDACLPVLFQHADLDAIAERNNFVERPMEWNSENDWRHWSHPYMAKTSVIVNDLGYCQITVRDREQHARRQQVVQLLAEAGLSFVEVATAANYHDREFSRQCGDEGTPFALVIEANGDDSDPHPSFSATIIGYEPAPPPFCAAGAQLH